MRICVRLLLALSLLGTVAAQEPNSILKDWTGADRGPVPITFFGLHINHEWHPFPPFPFGSYRFWDDHTRWQLIETGPDKWNWQEVDNWIDLVTSHGVKDGTYILGGPPPWAVTLTGTENCDYSDPQRTRTPGQGMCRPPKDLGDDAAGPNLIWRKSVSTIALHFKKSRMHISSWEVWQEFVRHDLKGGRTSSWMGTNEQLVRLSQDAMCIITGRGHVSATHETCQQVLKSVGLNEPVDPSALIIGPTAGIGHPLMDRRFEEYWETPGAADSADIVGLHEYPMEPEQIYDYFPRWHTTLPKEVQAKPLWMTEGGWHNGSVTDPDMQEAWVVRFNLLVRGLGIGRMYWYSYDTKGLGELMDTKAGTGFNRIREWMVGNTETGCSREGSVYTCNFAKPDGTPMIAVWDASQTCNGGQCSTTNFRVPARYTIYYTLDDTNSSAVRGGTVQVGAKPILLVGK